MIGGYNRIFLQPPRSALRGRSRSAGTTALSAFSSYPKVGAERAAPPVLRGAPEAGGISAARTVDRFSAESRHRSHVPSLIKAPMSSPFREGFLPENVPRCAVPLAFFPSYCAVRTAFLFVPVPVPSGQTMKLEPPPFLRRVFHAGCEGRHIMKLG